MRDNAWLRSRLDYIWGHYFSDVSKKNEVVALFGQKARTRLGSIKKNRLKEGISKITLTGFFKDEAIPEVIVDLTIAHELCHYAHGFSSPLPQLFSHPHQGRIVDRELIKRGLGDGLAYQKRWLKREWPKIVGKRVRRRRIIRKATPGNIWKLLISGLKDS